MTPNNNAYTNRRITAFGETKTIMQWKEDERCVLRRYETLSHRLLNTTMSPESAITTPSRKG